MRSLVAAVFFVLTLSLSALIIGFLGQVIGLSSHGRFVTHDTNALDDDTIDWDVHTIDDLDQVTNLDVVLVDLRFFAVSHDPHLKAVTV